MHLIHLYANIARRIKVSFIPRNTSMQYFMESLVLSLMEKFETKRIFSKSFETIENDSPQNFIPQNIFRRKKHFTCKININQKR